MIIIILLVIAVAFVGYAVVTQYQNALPGESVPKRIWAAIVAAGVAIGAAATSWLHGMTSP